MTKMDESAKLRTELEDLDFRLLVMFGVGLVFVVISQRVFSRLQGNFAQEI